MTRPHIEHDRRKLAEPWRCSVVIRKGAAYGAPCRCPRIAVSAWHGLSTVGPFVVLRCAVHDRDALANFDIGAGGLVHRQSISRAWLPRVRPGLALVDYTSTGPWELDEIRAGRGRFVPRELR